MAVGGPRLELISCKVYSLVYSLSPAPQGNVEVVLKISSNNEKKSAYNRGIIFAVGFITYPFVL